jgi:hypothetical protein
LKERLCQALIDQTQTGNRTAYKALANGIGLELPQTIHRLGEALKMGRCMSAGAPHDFPQWTGRRRRSQEQYHDGASHGWHQDGR